jgi:LysM repeat protein
MRLRHKLAFKYFAAAILLFMVGYAAAWVSSWSHHTTTTKKTVPKVAVSPETQKLSPNDKSKPTPKSGTEYTVRSGDTLSSIASAHGTTFDQLAQYNNIPYPYNLTIGQVITIPPAK